jgi:hypothetical protein
MTKQKIVIARSLAFGGTTKRSHNSSLTQRYEIASSRPEVGIRNDESHFVNNLSVLRKTALFIIAALVLFAGCFKNPVSTRGTENPYGSSGTWETPQSPEVAVTNLLYAYNEMIIANYRLCFSDLFMYSSPEDSIDAVNNGRPDLFAGWNKSVEVSVASNIFSTFSNSDSLSYILALSEDDNYTDQIEDDAAILYRRYDLVIFTSNEDTSYTETYSGLSIFHLREEQLNWWTVNLWEDIPASTGDDWGDFKALYR